MPTPQTTTKIVPEFTPKPTPKQSSPNQDVYTLPPPAETPQSFYSRVLSGVTQSMMTTTPVEAQTQAETELDPLIFAVIIAAAVVVLCLVAAGVMLYGFVFYIH